MAKNDHTPPRLAPKVARKILSPVEHFMHTESAGGIVLLATTLIAMWWANSGFAEAYNHFVHTPVGFQFGAFELKKSLQHWVNDGLMAIFFYVVGLEIKREIIVGELSTARKAALPIFGALGGMIVPALFYAYFNYDGKYASGWGIPMATDIAFAVGILSMLGSRIPLSLRVFLLALAIVDDLGAVMVIAIFYTEQISQAALGGSAAMLGLIYLLRFAGIHGIVLHLILATITWFLVLKSGVHATVAGVILGFLTPISIFYDKTITKRKIRELSEDITAEIATLKEEDYKLSAAGEEKLDELKAEVFNAESPLESLIKFWHPYVAYFIMPIFALVNAGVALGGIQSMSAFIGSTITEGIVLGLYLGKPLGIVGFCYLAYKLKLGDLPKGANWTQLTGTGFLAGIGFTMALFIAHLALKVETAEVYSKVSILVASVLAGVTGLVLLYFSSSKKS